MYTHFVCHNGIKLIMYSHLIFLIPKIWQVVICFIILSIIESVEKISHQVWGYFKDITYSIGLPKIFHCIVTAYLPRWHLSPQKEVKLFVKEISRMPQIRFPSMTFWWPGTPYCLTQWVILHYIWLNFWAASSNICLLTSLGLRSFK